VTCARARPASPNRKEILVINLKRGVVFRRHGHFLITWALGETGQPLAFHVAPQTGPRHRSHVPLKADDCAALGMGRVTSIIDTAAPLVDIVGAVPVGCASERLCQRIATAIRHNQETALHEGRWAPTPWR
jgi:hypothetical protein